MRTYFLFNASAILLPKDVFPTPGGPYRQRMGDFRSPLSDSTAIYSRMRSFFDAAKERKETPYYLMVNDDVVFEQTAWGAKTVKNARPFDARHIRLICGRNSLDYSYGDKNVRAMKVGEVGEKVLDIWNARLADVRKKFLHVRTVVLLKGEDLREVSVYEEETCLFEPRKYYWQVNDKGNFEGFEVATGVHRFTWQPHGSQFTVISDVPKKTFEIANQTPHTGFSKCRAEGCGI